MPLNVVLVWLDDTPVQTLERMPYLSSRPHGSWVHLTRGTINNPTCGPSRVTLHTGQHARRHGASTNRKTLQRFEGGVDPDTKIGPALQAAGYTTAYWGKHENGFPWVGHGGDRQWLPPGWDTLALFRGRGAGGTGPGYYEYELIREDATIDSYGSTGDDYSTDVLMAEAADWVLRAPEPFLAYLSLNAPHDVADGNLTHPRHARLYEGEVDRRPNHNALMVNPPTWLAERAAEPRGRAWIAEQDELTRQRWRALKAVDEGLEELVAAVRRRGLLDDTVIMVLGDNSNLSGQHRLRGKGFLFEESINPYWMVRWPGAEERDDDAVTSHIDIAPTLTDIAGTRMPHAPDGMSLRPLILDEGNWRDGVMVNYEQQAPGGDAHDPARSFDAVRTTRWVFARHWNGDIQMHDMAEDPYQMVNVAGHDDHRRMQDALSEYLDRMLAVTVKHPTYPGHR